jgi:hypothetical protein
MVGFSSNFDTMVRIEGERLNVGGSSVGMQGGEVIARHVALHQDGNVVHGPASPGLKWQAVPPLDGAGFSAGDALAIGCETYLVEADGSLPTFATVTWSQIVTLEGK